LTAGQQSTIEETSLWQAKNTTAELDGLLGKRPGLNKWGQTLQKTNGNINDNIAAATAAVSFDEFFLDLTNWTENDQSGTPAKIVNTLVQGQLQTTVAPGTSNEYLVLSRNATSVKTAWSVRVAARGTDLPAYTTDATVPNTLVFRADSDGSNGAEFALHDQGLYYKAVTTGKYTPVAGTAAIGYGGWNVIEVQRDAAYTYVYLNETLVDTILNTAFAVVSLTAGAVAELRWEVEGVAATQGAPAQYSTKVSSFQWIDAVDTTDDSGDAVTAFEAEEVKAISEYNYSTRAGARQPVLLAAAGNLVYHDDGQVGWWRALLRNTLPETFLTVFRTDAIIINSGGGRNSVVTKWDGKETEVLDDAPNIRFATEHKQRLWGAGDPEFPLRAYFSGDRQPNLWFSPSPDNIESETDAAEQAGYIEVPSKKGDAITALYGDFYGRVLIFTRRSVYQVGGDGPASFAMSAVSQDVGAENSDCVTQVGNDLWFLGRYGVQALSSTDQFGDIVSSFPSAPISDIWGQSPSTVKTVSRDYTYLSKLKYNPTQGLVYCAVPLTGQKTPDSIFIYNVNTKEWYGPWTIQTQAMENVEIGKPSIEVMMHGSTTGKVLYTNQGTRSDDGVAYTMTLQSAMLNGRSVDPMLVGMEKVWKTLRLFVLPRGEWDFTVSWLTDTKKIVSQTVSQNPQNQYVIGATEGDGTGDFRIGLDPDGRLQSRENMVPIEIQLDSVGRNLWFQLDQSGLGQDLVLQGFEVEFTASGYSKE
jgi:hypothetical protein